MATGELGAMNLTESSRNEMDETFTQNDAAVTFTNHTGSVHTCTLASYTNTTVNNRIVSSVDCYDS